MKGTSNYGYVLPVRRSLVDSMSTLTNTQGKVRKKTEYEKKQYQVPPKFMLACLVLGDWMLRCKTVKQIAAERGLKENYVYGVVSRKTYKDAEPC